MSEIKWSGNAQDGTLKLEIEFGEVSENLEYGIGVFRVNLLKDIIKGLVYSEEELKQNELAYNEFNKHCDETRLDDLEKKYPLMQVRSDGCFSWPELELDSNQILCALAQTPTTIDMVMDLIDSGENGENNV